MVTYQVVLVDSSTLDVTLVLDEGEDADIDADVDSVVDIALMWGISEMDIDGIVLINSRPWLGERIA